MGQLNESDYLKLPNPYYGRSDGWFQEVSTGDLVAVVDGVEKFRVGTSGSESISLAEGNVLVGNATGVGAALDASGDGYLLVGDGTTVNSVATSGDVTVTNTGAITIGSGKITSEKLAEGLLRYAEVTISSADITGTDAGQLSHASGYPLVAAPGAGKAIEFISALAIYDYATAPYGGGGLLAVKYTGSDAVSGTATPINTIGAGDDTAALLLPAVPTNNQALRNTGLSLTTSVAYTNPGTAAGVVRVKVVYRVHSTGL